jgi:hypothetical protein
LPSGTYGRHDYPDVFISMKRISSQDLKPKKRGNYSDTGLIQENGNSHRYIGGIDFESMQEITKPGLSLVLARELLKQLYAGVTDRRVVYDGNGKHIDTKILQAVFDDMVKVRAPHRSEWLDTRFCTPSEEIQKKECYDFLGSAGEEDYRGMERIEFSDWVAKWNSGITYPVFKNGSWEYVTEVLEECLLEDYCGCPKHAKDTEDEGIDFLDWLKNATSQGLPRKKSKHGKLNYEHPSMGGAIRFGASHNGFILACREHPENKYDSLGTRSVRTELD